MGIWCVSLVSVSQTSWCLAGSEYRMFHPRRSMGLWPNNIQHRPFHTHCSDEGEPGQCLCRSPSTAVAVRMQKVEEQVLKQGFQHCATIRVKYLHQVQWRSQSWNMTIENNQFKESNWFWILQKREPQCLSSSLVTGNYKINVPVLKRSACQW